MLTNTLGKYAVPPARARRRAQAMWSDLAWPHDGGGIKAFHTALRQALMACDRQNVAKAEHDVVMRYLELIPRECAIYLEDPLRVPKPTGWTLEPLLKEAEEYYELRKAYPVKDEDGLIRRPGAQTRARRTKTQPTFEPQPQQQISLQPQQQIPLQPQQRTQCTQPGSSQQVVHQSASWDNDRK